MADLAGRVDVRLHPVWLECPAAQVIDRARASRSGPHPGDDDTPAFFAFGPANDGGCHIPERVDEALAEGSARN